MTAPKLPESKVDPRFRSPREYCKHELTAEHTLYICAIKRRYTVCIQCGSEVE